MLELMARIHKDFTYDTQATTVHTPLVEVFAQRRGVCQDLAHVQIGCLRSLGLAARYVSGYSARFRPLAARAWSAPMRRTPGWVCIADTWAGSISIRPITPWSTRTISRSRGGAITPDVCPINGVFVGGGQHVMTVSADVEPLDSEVPPHSASTRRDVTK